MSYKVTAVTVTFTSSVQTIVRLINFHCILQCCNIDLETGRVYKGIQPVEETPPVGLKDLFLGSVFLSYCEKRKLHIQPFYGPFRGSPG